MKLGNLTALLLACGATLSIALATSNLAIADEYVGTDDCQTCRHHKVHNRLHPYRYVEGRDPSYNCGCNGSYKFPVPPLSTYHWPGMYSHQLMTDYHSPWRFPPLRPYVDEPKAEATEAVTPKTSRVRMVPVPR